MHYSKDSMKRTKDNTHYFKGDMKCTNGNMYFAKDSMPCAKGKVKVCDIFTAIPNLKT